jgi:hypothetical protein
LNEAQQSSVLPSDQNTRKMVARSELSAAGNEQGYMSDTGQGSGQLVQFQADTAHPSAVRHAVTRICIDGHKLEFSELHRLITAHKGRVELNTADGHTCVLISKSELDAMEQALSILADGDAVQAMRQELAKVATAAAGR